MKIQLFHITTDSDLSIGRTVCGQNESGEWALTGKISTIYGDNFPVLYRIDSFGGLYTADEVNAILKQFIAKITE